MMDKIEKWQKALQYWPKWNHSITDCRERIQNEFGDLDELLANAKFKVELIGEADKPIINIDMNKAEETIWEVIDKIRKFSHEFTLQNIGISPDSFQFHVFQTRWLKSAFPTLANWFELELNDEEDMSKLVCSILQSDCTVHWTEPLVCLDLIIVT